ncbi:hypothetical protein PYCC9005_005020 [Savitreella phatthalungensis]
MVDEFVEREKEDLTLSPRRVRRGMTADPDPEYQLPLDESDDDRSLDGGEPCSDDLLDIRLWGDYADDGGSEDVEDLRYADDDKDDGDYMDAGDVSDDCDISDNDRPRKRSRKQPGSQKKKKKQQQKKKIKKKSTFKKTEIVEPAILKEEPCDDAGSGGDPLLKTPQSAPTPRTTPRSRPRPRRKWVSLWRVVNPEWPVTVGDKTGTPDGRSLIPRPPVRQLVLRNGSDHVRVTWESDEAVASWRARCTAAERPAASAGETQEEAQPSEVEAEVATVDVPAGVTESD